MTHACDAIVIDYNLLEEDKIPLDFHLQDSYPCLRTLDRTAKQGCSFCVLLIDSIRKAFDTQNLPLPIDFNISGKLLTENTLDSEEQCVYAIALDITYGKDEKIPLYFSVSAAEGTAAATEGRIRRRPLHDKVTSIAALKLIEQWISECRSDHDGCKLRKDPELPTRVLDLRTGDLGLNCRLVQSDSVRDKQVSYIALSHCWGLSTDTPMTTTTSSTLSQRMLDIPLESLPQNFKDAITITKLLGIQYLWIDSLCIIQDSKDDWEKEGGRMSQIYEGAYLTIAATSASNANDGFLLRTPPIYASFPFRTSTSTYQTGELLLKPTDKAILTFENDIDLSVWNGRAWTLQERYLSRRMLHFCQDKLYFECRSGSRSEHNELEFLVRFPVIFDDEETSDDNSSSVAGDDQGDGEDVNNNDENTNDGAYASETSDRIENPMDEEDDEILEVDYSFYLFYRLIGQYSPRKLTFASDKLPALAGVANNVHVQSGSTYLAGLWEDDLAYGLLWSAPDPSTTHATTIYRAPSWSWASLEGQITWPTYWNVSDCPNAGRPFNSAIWIVDAVCHVEGANPYGQVTSAHLILRAKSMLVRVSGPTGRKHRRGWVSSFPYNLLVPDQADEQVIGYGVLDLANYEFIGKEIYCLQIHEQLPEICEPESSWSGLILEVVKRDGEALPVFKRIGIYLLCENSLDVFDSVEEKELKIV